MEKTNGREVLPDCSRKKKTTTFHSSPVGNLPLKATSSERWPGPRTEDKQPASRTRSDNKMQQLTRKDFRNRFTRSCDSNQE